MKLYAHHTPDGSILSIYILQAGDPFGAGMVPKEGSSVSEISDHPFSSPSPGREELNSLSRTHKVSTSSGKARLTKK